MRIAKGNGCVSISQLFQCIVDRLFFSSILVASVLHNLHKENGTVTHVKVKGQEKETSGEGSEGQGEIKQVVDKAVLLFDLFLVCLSYIVYFAQYSSCFNRADM